MKLEQFDFYLPEELIAQTPLLKRDTSKLLCIDKKENTNPPFEYEHAEPYSEPTEEWEDYYYLLIKNGKELTIDKEGNFL